MPLPQPRSTPDRGTLEPITAPGFLRAWWVPDVAIAMLRISVAGILLIHGIQEHYGLFLPGGEKQYAGPANAEIFVDLEGDDVPDHFEGNEADLSDLIVQTLALAVDLYPREPNASLEDTGFKPDVDKTSPFDALKALKPKE